MPLEVPRGDGGRRGGEKAQYEKYGNPRQVLYNLGGGLVWGIE